MADRSGGGVLGTPPSRFGSIPEASLRPSGAASARRGALVRPVWSAATSASEKADDDTDGRTGGKGAAPVQHGPPVLARQFTGGMTRKRTAEARSTATGGQMSFCRHGLGCPTGAGRNSQWYDCSRSGKRSEALQECNFTRNNRADGAPTGASLGRCRHWWHRPFSPVGHQSPCLRKLRGLGRSPKDTYALSG